LIFGLKLFLPSLLLASIGIFIYLRSDREKKSRLLVEFALLWLPVEIIFSLISGREYFHYFLSWIIPIGLLIPLFFYRINKKYLPSILLVTLLIGYGGQVIILTNNFYKLRPFDIHLNYRGFNFNNFGEHADTLGAIAQSSGVQDNVLIWGSEPSLLFLSNRQTFSRYYYQMRLFYPGYNLDDSKTKELYNDLLANPPILIIDAASSSADIEINDFLTLPPLDKAGMLNWLNQTKTKNRDNLIAISNFVKAYYVPWKMTYQNHWLIYKRI
jgi:hypothetical protein